MKLPIKKVYCTKCRKLVRGQEQTSSSTERIICPRCGQPLWVWENITWRHLGKLESI